MLFYGVLILLNRSDEFLAPLGFLSHCTALSISILDEISRQPQKKKKKIVSPTLILIYQYII